IRSNDPTDPDTLLVNINVRSDSQRNAGRSQYGPSSSLARNLAPTENVLDPAPTSNMARANGMSESDEDEEELGAGFANYRPLGDEGIVSSPEGSDSDDIVNQLGQQMRTALGDIGVTSNGEGDNAGPGAVNSANPSRGSSNTAKPNGRTRHTSDRTGLRRPHRLGAPEPAISSGHDLRELTRTRSHNTPDDKLSRSAQSVPHTPVDAAANHQRLLKKHQFRTAAGIPVPGVTYNQYRKLERIAMTEVGPSDEQIIENAGRSCAIMCIKILGGSRRIKPNNHNAPPVVLFMCGNNRLGAIGLCAARHLVNHGCEVLATVAGKNRDFVKHVYNQLPLTGKSGVRLLPANSELPDHHVTPVDVIVDGLLGAYQTFKGLTVESERVLVSKLVGWANGNKAPVLSLEMPSGHANLTPAELELAPSDQAIVPRWTLCFGAPSAALTSRDMTGELTLADVGIPHVMWTRAGVKTWSNPWGADFLVPLEYA
ncbi:enhancer of mRNA decapping, partial [Dispira parvispora]